MQSGRVLVLSVGFCCCLFWGFFVAVPDTSQHTFKTANVTHFIAKYDRRRITVFTV